MSSTEDTTPNHKNPYDSDDDMQVDSHDEYARAPDVDADGESVDDETYSPAGPSSAHPGPRSSRAHSVRSVCVWRGDYMHLTWLIWRRMTTIR